LPAGPGCFFQILSLTMMKKIGQYFRKEYGKFKRKRWYGKLIDVVFVVLLILLIIPSSRKEVMTYASKVRMYLTSVEESAAPQKLASLHTLQFVDQEGAYHQLDDFLDKPVFINYWATWCPPCRAEMPALEKLYQQYGGRVHFLFISKQPMERQQAFLTSQGYDLPVYQLASRPGGSLSYSVLPTSLVISKDNRMLLRKEGAVNWQSKQVKKIFEGLAQED